MNVGILIPSHDGYSDLWPIAGELFTRFWPDRDWPMYWMTSGAAVPDIANPILRPVVQRTEWGDNIAAAIEQMPEPLILFWVEEILLLSKVPNDVLLEAATIVNANASVAVVNLTRYYAQPDNPTCGSFADYPRNAQGFVSAMPAIFRRDVLIHLLRTAKNGRDFEVDGKAIIQRDMPEVRSLIPCRPMFRYCDNALLGEHNGAWRKCAVKHLTDNGFDMDFNIRGISWYPCDLMDGAVA